MLLINKDENIDELWVKRDVWLNITNDNRSIYCSEILCQAMRGQVEKWIIKVKS